MRIRKWITSKYHIENSFVIIKQYLKMYNKEQKLTIIIFITYK